MASSGRLRARLKNDLLEGIPIVGFDLKILFVGSCIRRLSDFPSYSWAGWAGAVQCFMPLGKLVEFLLLSEGSGQVEDIIPRASISEPRGAQSHSWRYYWIMLISWEVGVAKRLGIGTVDADSVQESYELELVREEILLA
ncbi:hypothetical protein ETB97_007840 [Aspergillus alliaceus]|uniref:Uncharacterized protein n=1 Tax=Petromyces alliaceus TaxID=209559 RepID=A0A8H5ZTP7_PETAA|nr:hypothetical protein ETB97_007840 [Aspergillus burnettii]